MYHAVLPHSRCALFAQSIFWTPAFKSKQYDIVQPFSLLLPAHTCTITSNIEPCQKKHVANLAAPLSTFRVASHRPIKGSTVATMGRCEWERRSKQTSFSNHFPITGKKHRRFRNCTDSPQQRVCPKVSRLQTFAPLFKSGALQPLLI